LAIKQVEGGVDEDRVSFACSAFGKKLERLAAQLRFKGDEQAEAAEKKLDNKFYSQCNADTSTFALDNTTRIDFLGLKQLLHNVVEKQDKAIYRGIPDITLSALNLTSAFQLTMEAQAGTHFFKIVPVLAPPNTEFKIDHTHTLKIVLNGKKGKGDKQNPKRLADSCRERIGDDAYSATVARRDASHEAALKAEREVEQAKRAVRTAKAVADQAKAVADKAAADKGAADRAASNKAAIDKASADKAAADKVKTAADDAYAWAKANAKRAYEIAVAARAAVGSDPPHFCDTGPGQLLESIIQAQEKSGGGAQ
jgi:hypothetical protein